MEWMQTCCPCSKSIGDVSHNWLKWTFRNSKPPYLMGRIMVPGTVDDDWFMIGQLKTSYLHFCCDLSLLRHVFRYLSSVSRQRWALGLGSLASDERDAKLPGAEQWAWKLGPDMGRFEAATVAFSPRWWNKWGYKTHIGSYWNTMGYHGISWDISNLRGVIEI